MAADTARCTRPTLPPRAARLRRAAAAACALAVTLLLAAPTVHAQWKWRDLSGVMHFSDRPPPASVPEKDILQRPSASRLATASAAIAPSAPPAAAASAVPATRTAEATRAKNPAEQQLEARRKADEQERAAKAKADEDRQAAARADNCSRARSALATLESGQRITRVNEKGEREFLDDRQRADEVRRSREVIAADCR